MKSKISKIKIRIADVIIKEGFKSLFKMLRNRIKYNFYAILLRFKIKQLNKNYNLKSLIDFSFLTYEGLIKPYQITSELQSFLNFVKTQKPKYVLEIGTAFGGTLFLLSRTVSKDAIIISLDLPRSKYGISYQKWRTKLYYTFALPNQQVCLIRGDSHDTKTLNEVKKILNGNKIDLLYVDGDHSYNGVKKDFELYSQLVNDNGFVVFHDILLDGYKNYNVNKFWKEIKNRYENFEFVENLNQGFAGFGIIQFKK